MHVPRTCGTAVDGCHAPLLIWEISLTDAVANDRTAMNDHAKTQRRQKDGKFASQGKPAVSAPTAAVKYTCGACGITSGKYGVVDHETGVCYDASHCENRQQGGCEPIFEDALDPWGIKCWCGGKMYRDSEGGKCEATNKLLTPRFVRLI